MEVTDGTQRSDRVYKRNVYHSAAQTDLAKIREHAILHSQTEGLVMIHLHDFEDGGCDFAADNHELYKDGVKVEIEYQPLFDKYKVYRTDGNDVYPWDKHHKCRYFVLDLTHDAHAIPAVKAYIESCRQDKPALAAGLEKLLPKEATE